MRAAWVLALLPSAMGCGARTGLAVDGGAGSPDAGIPTECVPDEPERFGSEDASPRAVDGRNLWAAFGGMDFVIGVVDTETGAVERVSEGRLFGQWGFAARDGEAWWSHSGFSDFAGQIVHADRRRRVRVLEEGLFQPGGVQHDGDHVFFAEWTNDGRPGDDMRARIVRMDPDGRRQRDLATGLGLPTQTALSGDHIYWVDRDRRHVARVGKNGGEVEVVVDDVAVLSVIASRGVAVFFAVATPVWNQVLAWDSTTGDIQVLAELEEEIRGITPTEHGLLLELFSGPTRLAFRPWARNDVVHVDEGSEAVADGRRAYWRRGGREDFGLVRVCLPWLSTL